MEQGEFPLGELHCWSLCLCGLTHWVMPQGVVGEDLEMLQPLTAMPYVVATVACWCLENSYHNLQGHQTLAWGKL